MTSSGTSSSSRAPESRRPAGDDRRVVVTGWGMVTSLGAGVEATFAALRAGHSGVRRLTRFDATGLPCDIAAEIGLEVLSDPHPDDAVGGSELRLLRTALGEALSTVDLDRGLDRYRIAVVIGGHGETPDVLSIQTAARHQDGAGIMDLEALRTDPAFSSVALARRLPEVAPTLLAHQLDARGPVLPIVSACAAGSQAIGEGFRMLRDGRAEVAVVGGAEPLLSFSYFLGFALLGALTRRYPSPEGASRPFDRRRNGFVIGEGAALLVLETLAGARARRREVLGEILGYGESADAYRITDVHPRGDGALAAMARAIEDAGLRPADVEYVNAHGTSTPTNDPVETLALKRLLGDRAYQVPVSSNKSMLGHTIGAAGAIEAILTLRGMAAGVLLPTINQEAPDPRCDLDYVPNVAREQPHRVAISNSFGFGGQNACLCLGAARGVS